MSRYVITGATGHIGNTIARQLCSAGIRPTLIVRSADDPAIRGLEADFAVGSFFDKKLLSSLLQPEDIVIHSAGMIAITEKDAETVMKINLGGTVAVADACAEARIQKLVYIGSVDAIYKPDKSSPISEPSGFFPDLLGSTYAKSKALATQYVLNKVSDGLSVCVLYPTAVVGPNDYKVSMVGQVVSDYITNMPLARVNGCYNFVDVRDVASAVIRAAECAPSGSSYILGGEIVSVDELFAILCEYHKRPTPPKLPLGFVKAFSPIVILYYKVRGKKPVFSKYALETLNSNCNYDITKARTELGYLPRPARDTLLDAAAWFASQRRI